MAEALPYTLSLRDRPIYPARCLLNLLRIGHCAPTVMQTGLQIAHNEQEWLVKLMAGMPGGIGNTQGECGGLTSPLIVLSLCHGLDEMSDSLPVLFDHGQIENSYPRVIRMLAKGMEIADENANHFHRTINAGQRLAEWFAVEFGSLQCQVITGCDFASTAGVEQYIARNGVAVCRKIAGATAAQVQTILAEMETGRVTS